VDIDRIRKAFPLLQGPSKQRPIYFDNACTSLKPQSVIDATVEYYRDTPVCGGRSVHRLGEAVSAKVETARRRLGAFIGARAPEEVVFTKGATEAINIVANGLNLRRGDVVLTTDKEHNSNWIPWLHLRQLRGIDVVAVASKPDGSFDSEAYESALRNAGARLRLVSMVHTSNADGAQIPAKEVAERAHEQGAKVLFDCAQSMPHEPIDVRVLGADFVAASAHKMLGPSGLGFLWGTQEALSEVDPLLYGGGAVHASKEDSYELHDVPMRFEAGLQNYAALAAFPAALDFLDRVGREWIQARDRTLNAYATKRLAAIDGVTIYGPDAPHRSAILPFNVAGLGPHDVALYLDEAQRIAVRSGAHCVNSYFDRRGIDGWVRASFYFYNQKEEIDAFADALTQLSAGVRTKVGKQVSKPRNRALRSR
jgi:cysteine desulfurase / selenocysteine lyase